MVFSKTFFFIFRCFLQSEESVEAIALKNRLLGLKSTVGVPLGAFFLGPPFWAWRHHVAQNFDKNPRGFPTKALQKGTLWFFIRCRCLRATRAPLWSDFWSIWGPFLAKFWCFSPSVLGPVSYLLLRCNEPVSRNWQHFPSILMLEIRLRLWFS